MTCVRQTHRASSPPHAPFFWNRADRDRTHYATAHQATASATDFKWTSRTLCGFCHAPGFFLPRHSGERFSCSYVADLLQQTGVGYMHITDDRLPLDQNGTRAVKSPVVKRSIVVAGHKTSVSLEDAFWTGLKEIAGGRHLTLSDMVAAIDSERRHGNLSSAIRLFVLDFYRRQLSDDNEGRDGTRGVIIARAASTA